MGLIQLAGRTRKMGDVREILTFSCSVQIASGACSYRTLLNLRFKLEIVEGVYTPYRLPLTLYHQ